jgi:hypothetical protein
MRFTPGLRLPLNFHPAAIRTFPGLLCCRTLDRWRLDFSAFDHDGGGCAIVIHWHYRRHLSDHPVEVFFVVVLVQILRLFSGLCRAQTPVGVQTFCSEATVECFDERVVRSDPPSLEKSSLTPR